MISAVVLAHNDENSIEKTLDSLSWCDERIVIDDVSTDSTTVIASRHDSTVFSHPLRDDFAAQRNFGLTKAKGDWVLFVDSDEIVSPSLALELQEKSAGSYKGYMVKRRDHMWGSELKFGETAQVKLLRFAKKNSGRWTRPVHEMWEINGEIGQLTEPLDHYPHSNVAQFIEEIGRYSTINAQYLFRRGKRTNVWEILAYPNAKLFVNYVIRLGFLDGTAGAVVAILMSLHSFLTRAKLWLLSNNGQRTS